MSSACRTLTLLFELFVDRLPKIMGLAVKFDTDRRWRLKRGHALCFRQYTA